MSIGTKEIMPFVPDSFHFRLHVCSAPPAFWVLATCLMEIPGHHGLLSSPSSISSQVPAQHLPGRGHCNFCAWDKLTTPTGHRVSHYSWSQIKHQTPKMFETTLSNQFTQPENMGQDLSGERQEMETIWQINSMSFTPLHIVLRIVAL